MQTVIEHISALVDHFKLENLNQKSTCFYCGEQHKTVDCESPERDVFHMTLTAIAEETREEESLLDDRHYGPGNEQGYVLPLSGLLEEVA